jgi:hypothetical protein
MATGWFLIALVIVGFLLWALASSPLAYWKISQFDRKTRKAGKFSSRLAHPRR